MTTHYPRKVTSSSAKSIASDVARAARPLSHADIAHPLRHRRALKPIEASRNVPAAPLSLVDAAFQLGIRPVELAQAVREGKWRRSVGAAAS